MSGFILHEPPAILNKHQAGTLWFGVRNNGTVAGIDINEVLNTISTSSK